MPRIEQDALVDFVATLIDELGSDSDEATKVASSLVAADARGHHSHGVRALPAKYYPEIQDDKIRPAATPTRLETGAFSGRVEGNRGFGQFAGRHATDLAVETAAEHGIGVVGVDGVSHIGRIGEWVERAVAHDMLFAAFVCNPGSQYVAPAGSAQPRLSTNPIAFGVPTYDALPFPLVLDIATSQVAHGKVREYAASDDTVPSNWLVTDDGTSLRDAGAFIDGDDGAILPLGGFTTGHKGFGLSVMMELFASILSDGTISGADGDTWGNTAVFVVIDPTLHTTQDGVEERVETFTTYLRDTDYSAPVSPGDAASGDRGLLPGEAEHRALRDTREHGVDIVDVDAALLRELAAELDLSDAVPAALDA
mgnify:CR=1 FL=1